MNVKRIVANIHAPNPSEADSFYREILGLEVIMDHGWLRTYASEAQMTVQVGIASQGGSGMPVPDLSVEVDDVEEAQRRAKAAGIAIEYGSASEPWGVRRFFVRDPFGKLVNILQHNDTPLPGSSYRKQLLDCLEILASGEGLITYEADIPVDYVPTELVCRFFDETYRPDIPEFLNEFSNDELRAIALFSGHLEIACEVVEAKGRPAAREVLKLPQWREMMKKAAGLLERMNKSGQ